MPRNGEIFKENFTCDNCEKENTWVYQHQESDRVGSQMYQVIKYYNIKSNETWLNYNGKNSSAYCNECGKLNQFESLID